MKAPLVSLTCVDLLGNARSFSRCREMVLGLDGDGELSGVSMLQRPEFSRVSLLCWVGQG